MTLRFFTTYTDKATSKIMPVVLEQRVVHQLNAPGYYADSALNGFFLKITTTGRKIFVVRKKPKGSRDKITITIGEFEAPYKCSSARKLAEEHIATMNLGFNPTEERRKRQQEELEERWIENERRERESLTLQDAFELYVNSKKKKHADGSGLKPSTIAAYRYDFEKRLKDWLTRPIFEISEDEVLDRHTEISENHAGQANHVMRVLRAVYNYAAFKHKVSKVNPVRILSHEKKWNKLKDRNTIIEDEQLKDWFAAVMALRNDTSRDFLLILIFTGLRHDEAAGLLWENVNFPGKTITVTDTKNNTDFVQPMSKFVYDLLRRRAKKKVSKIFVFPSNKSTSGRLESVYGAVKNVASMASVDWEPHDLRRSFATYAGLFVSESMVNRLINHVDKRSVTQAHYMRIKVEQMREPIEKVAQHLLQHSGDAFEQSSPLGSASELPQKQEKHQEDTIKLAK